MYGFYDRKTARVGTKIDKSPIALFCTFQLRGVFVSIYVTNTYENPKHFHMNSVVRQMWEQNTDEINGIQFELNSILVEKWEGKCYRLVIQRQRRNSGDLDLWEGEYTYRCILTNDYKSSTRDIVEFYNLRGGKERIFDDMNNGFGWSRLPKSFMAENTVFLLLTALIHNFYKTIMSRLDTKAFGLKKTSRIKAFVFSFISVPAKWIMTARQYVLNIYTENRAYAKPFKTEFG